MLTSVAYTPGRVPAIQQQFVSVCLPHTIFTLYVRDLPSSLYGAELLEKRMRWPAST